MEYINQFEKQWDRDLKEYADYIELMRCSNPHIIPYSFREVFGYEVVFYEDKGLKVIGNQTIRDESI